MFKLPFPVRDANASPASAPLGDLPEWNLDDLYTGEEAPELKHDLDWLEQHCSSFAADYEGKLAELDAAGFLECVLRNEKINQVASDQRQEHAQMRQELETQIEHHREPPQKPVRIEY